MKNIVKILSVIAALSTAFPAHAFEPGSDLIDEAEILKRIEAEVGLRIEKRGKTRSATVRVDRRPAVRILSPSGLRLKGRAHFASKTITIRTGPVIRKISLKDVKSIDITAWKAFRARKENKGFRVLMVPHQAILYMQNGESLKGDINGEEWLQLTVQTGSEFRTVVLGFSKSVQATSIDEAMKTADKLSPESELLARLHFEQWDVKNEVTSNMQR